MKKLLDPDLDLEPLRDRTVAVVGFGNQGHAHALNLRDSGIQVAVGARPGGAGWTGAKAAGFRPQPVEDAVRDADIAMLLLPDEVQPQVYRTQVEPRLRQGALLAFGHGFALRFRTLEPRPDLDVGLVAPVGPGHLLRSRFAEGGGIPVVIAVDQDRSGRSWDLVRAYAKALGGGRAGVLETTVADECETDLFGEQAVIVGGVAALMEAGFDTLRNAGYPEELAYFECVHQMKLLVDLVHEHGIAGMRDRISRTALFGDLTRGRRVIGPESRRAMQEILAEIRDGRFAEEWVHAKAEAWKAPLERARTHPLERVGAELRAAARGAGDASPETD
ncbi:MAG TPA: ketol-acid reductoisomerase [Myxococcales bacterium LLY-WYZ-16_1]|nr:ketol-acid reductoisomerase [Myxococcales bacterium LLY-WYZ-16_1]